MDPKDERPNQPWQNLNLENKEEQNTTKRLVWCANYSASSLLYRKLKCVDSLVNRPFRWMEVHILPH